ncbi:hypothetical protein M409DRAFT_63306 [Zasmidium cellare ATCC 36951]|uniref:Cytochrome P450 n=1 Tax=Zasmidium cellare ATCC 36951 TaxID=1080233 RepID=A0A6A6CX41_ZASCE|nr:uncharacterized protein M409DRAFT_63306 [Zasmidium cellare ATCC 36951]KAF2171691.1 hypothetical protein M409DRAFT_63306 [Zasmidium cellare ATCC 36951]
MWLTYISFAAAATIAASIIYNLFLHPLAGIPGPLLARITPLWIFCQCKNNRRPNLDLQLHQQYGSVVRISPNEVIFSNPAYFKTVYGAGSSRAWGRSPFLTVHNQFARDYDRLNMLLESDMDKLRFQRRVFGPVYSTANARKHEELIDNNDRRFAARLQSLAGQVMDFYVELEYLGVDIYCEMTFGEAFGAVERGDDGGQMESMAKRWSWIGYIGFIPWLCALQHELMKRNVPFSQFRCPFPVHAVPTIEDTITPCILDDLQIVSKTKSGVGRSWATDMAMTNIGAGIDTTSWTLAAVVATVGSNPSAYEKLQTELEDAVKSGLIKKNTPVPYDATLSLPYLQACVNEAMRLYPNVAVSLARIVPQEGIVLDGYYIPPKYIVGMNSKQLGLSEEVFGADTSSFIPERWLEASKEQLGEMESRNLGFGGPSRKCPGKNVAWVAMAKILAGLYLNFEVEVLNKLGGEEGPGGRRWIELGSFPTKWEGMEVRVQPR